MDTSRALRRVHGGAVVIILATGPLGVTPPERSAESPPVYPNAWDLPLSRLNRRPLSRDRDRSTNRHDARLARGAHVHSQWQPVAHAVNRAVGCCSLT